METLFGVSMNIIMAVLLGIFLIAMTTTVALAWRNRIMLKLGLRNIPRRRAQTVLIVVGVMLSTVIISAAFGTGDTMTFSIRNNAVERLGPIDEIITGARGASFSGLGSPPYFPYARFEELRTQQADFRDIDGMVPVVAESVPVLNPRTSLSEGRVTVHGVAPGLLSGFGTLTLLSGHQVTLDDLRKGEAYVDDHTAEDLDAVAGDTLRLFIRGGAVEVTVKGVVEGRGISGRGSTLVVPLAQAQELFDKPGLINGILVSNRGDDMGGARVSRAVARELRVLLTDEAVAGQLLTALAREPVYQALATRQEGLRGNLKEDVGRLSQELRRGEVTPELRSLLADDALSSQVLVALRNAGLPEVEREVTTLFAELSELHVTTVKRDALDTAELVGSGVTSIFIIMGLFSIMVGVLLIFLIFVMLAAARRTEMGMTRAVGAKRGHLVQTFLFEGTAYNLAAAAVGALLGLGVSFAMVRLINQMIDVEGFTITPHFEVRSLVVAYCLGMVITFATVTVASYRVSRLNIVAAIRGLPDRPVVARGGWRRSLAALGPALARPFLLWGKAVGALFTLHPVAALKHLLRGAMAVLAFYGLLLKVPAQLAWAPLAQGWLTSLIGLLLAVQGVAIKQAAPFTIGFSLLAIGLGLMIRWGLRRTPMRAQLQDRIAFTFIGVVLLIFWVLPFDTLDFITGTLNSNIEMFFISGISMVAAAVWTVVYNADLLVRGITALTGRLGKLRPVLVLAVAYPMSAKFRTGLTLAMFALVIFTLMVMSIMTNANRQMLERIDEVGGGWDIEATVSYNNPIPDIHQAIAQAPDLDPSDFEAIGGYVWAPIEVRQVGAQKQEWERYGLQAADAEFLGNTQYGFTLIAEGYGETKEEVWQALKADPHLAVIDVFAVPSRQGGEFFFGGPEFQVEGLYREDERMPPIDIEVREPRTGQMLRLTVIGVLDQLADRFSTVITSKANLDAVFPVPVPNTTYRFKVAPGVDTVAAAKSLEASFLQNGMQAESLEERAREQLASSQAFNNLFTGFMALGLMVGIAALGVISLRAVVERRQQIGVLRAIGYRRRMVALSFLLESSFVALLGILIGVVLGGILSYNIVQEISQEIEGLRFTVPWLQITAIVLVAYLFSLVTTFLPARQASRIYPAEALRYE